MYVPALYIMQISFTKKKFVIICKGSKKFSSQKKTLILLL